MAWKHCSKCNSERFTDNKYCNRCGVEMVDNDKCDCGYELGVWDKFCSICGKKRGVQDDRERGN